MKKIAYKIILLIPILIAVMSCDLDDMINNRPSPGEEEIAPEESFGKKGYGQTLKSPVWSNCVANVMPYWHYSWGSDYPTGLPDNVEFVPMIWGRNDVEGKVEKLKALAAEGKINYLLGFNEPDKEDQAHMSVEEAIELWPLLESVGVPLGSPAPASMGSGWLDDFMSQANAKGLRVDFICMHRYTDSIDPNKWMEAFQNANTKWGLPIWITEMGLADWTATTPENNKRTKEQAYDLMEALLPMMDQASYIQRYAWFDGGRAKNQAALHISTIYEQNTDMLTTLGDLYAENDPNLKAGSGNGELPEAGDYGLVIDGGFEFRNVEGAWTGYDNGFTDETAAKKGLISGKIQADKNGDGGSMIQAIEVEPNTVYEFKYSTKWAETPDGTMMVQVQDRTPDTKPEAGWERLYIEELSTSTDWTDVTTKFTTGPSTTSAYLVFYKGGTNDGSNAGLTVLYLDEVAVFKTDEQVDPEPEPKPVPDSGLIIDGGYEATTAGPFPSSGDSWYGFDGNFVNGVADAHTGEKYAILATDNNADGAFLNHKLNTVEGYKEYTLDLHSKWGNVPTTAGIVKVFDITSGGKVELLNSNYASQTDWTNSSFTFETGENTAEIQITIIKPGAEANNTVMIDDVLLFETGDVTPAPPVKVNLVQKGDFEDVTAGALKADSSPWSGYNSGTADIVTSALATPYEGAQCARLKKDEASIAQTITVEEGKTYVFSMFTKWSDGDGVDLKFTIKPSNVGSIKHQETITASTTWTETTFEYTVPAGHTSLTFNVYKAKNNAAGFFYLDNVVVTEK
ncbi:glycosyl hydrolase [Flammeovirga sp. OC4]|uniref:glycosyl hydrolase n=1 Tax=Flammeovirga sp. OC4 TaxID=1382345 RepID=UPI00069417C8|nr:glycosyl hydrolase [Flammeovirga sp. OC4]